MICNLRKSKHPQLAIPTGYAVLSQVPSNNITPFKWYDFNGYPVDDMNAPLRGTIVDDSNVPIDIEVQRPCPTINFNVWYLQPKR